MKIKDFFLKSSKKLWFQAISTILFMGVMYVAFIPFQKTSVEFEFTQPINIGEFNGFSVFAVENYKQAHFSNGIYYVYQCGSNPEKTKFSCKIAKNFKELRFSPNAYNKQLFLKSITIDGTKLEYDKIKLGDCSITYDKNADATILQMASGQNIYPVIKSLPELNPHTQWYIWSTIIISGALFFFLLRYHQKLNPLWKNIVKYRRFIFNSLVFIAIANVLTLVVLMFYPETEFVVEFKNPPKQPVQYYLAHYIIARPVYYNIGKNFFIKQENNIYKTHLPPITQNIAFFSKNCIGNLKTVYVNNHVFHEKDMRLADVGIFYYHFEQEFQNFQKRLCVTLLITNSFLFLICCVVFYVIYIKLKCVAADKIIEKKQNKTVFSLRESLLSSFSISKFNLNSTLLSICLCAMFLFVAFHIFYGNFQKAIYYPRETDEFAYCALAAAHSRNSLTCNSSSDTLQPYPFLETASPGVQMPLGLLIKLFGANPIYYGIFLTLLRNIIVVLLCAFVFLALKTSFLQKCIWATFILLFHNTLPVIELHSNWSALGFSIMLFVLAAYILYFKNSSKLFVFISGLIAAYSTLARSSISHLAILLPFVYFFITFNLSRNFRKCIVDFVLWFVAYLTIIFGWEIFLISNYGYEVYTKELPLVKRTTLFNRFALSAGSWNLEWFFKLISSNIERLQIRLGYFVYFYPIILLYSFITILSCRLKKVENYMPFAVIVTTFPQVLLWLTVPRHERYITLVYLASILALCGILLLNYKRDSIAMSNAAMLCCIFWINCTPGALMRVRNYAFKIPTNTIEMLNYNLGDYFYPDAAFLVLYPKYPRGDLRLFYTNPRMKRFKTLEEFEKLFDPNGTILTIGTEQELFMKKLPADIIYKEVERDKKYIWYYCTRKS